MYDDDLSYVHHQGFGDFARRAAPGVLDMLAAARIADGLVVDVGCGSGIWLAALGAAGYDAVGVDVSPAFVRMARKRAPRAGVRIGSAYEFDFPQCAAVTALSEVLGYVPPGARKAPSLRRLFQRVAGALPLGGLFVFDMVMPARTRPMSYRTWRAGEDWAVLVEVDEDPARRRLARRMTTFRRVGKSYRRAQEDHVVRLVPRAEIEADLRAAGFSVRAARRYGNFELPAQRLAFRARKTG